MSPGGIHKIPTWFHLKMNIIHSKGLTLTELLLAAAILAFVLCGVVALFVNCSFLNEANRNLTVAMTHAQYIMEEIRDSGFSQVESNINNGNWNLNAAVIGATPYNLSALNSEAINTGVSQSGDPLGVSVTVSWNDRRQRARSITLDTRLTDYQ